MPSSSRALALKSPMLIIAGDADMMTLDLMFGMIEPFLKGETPKGMF